MESRDPRVKAAIMKCPSISMSGGGTLHTARTDRHTPVMVMLGREDTVIGEGGNAAGHEYVQTHEVGAAGIESALRGWGRARNWQAAVGFVRSAHADPC